MLCLPVEVSGASVLQHWYRFSPLGYVLIARQPAPSAGCVQATVAVPWGFFVILVLVYFKMNTTCLIGSEKGKEKLSD